MKKLISIIKISLLVVLTLAIVGGSIYGCYCIAKTVSYSFFYEDMVKRTIVQMVKPEYLKEIKQ